GGWVWAAGSLRFAAVGLFVGRASAVNAEFVVDDDNAVLVAGLCQRLDGLPLAIELAAVRVRSLSLAQIAQGLGDRFELLATGSRAGLARHQTLRAAVDWSFELCSKSERVLWMRAVVFAGGFDLAAAERVCGADGLAGGELVVALDGLVAKSVLLATDGVEGRRYRLLDPLSLYGLERRRRPVGDTGCGWSGWWRPTRAPGGTGSGHSAPTFDFSSCRASTRRRPSWRGSSCCVPPGSTTRPRCPVRGSSALTVAATPVHRPRRDGCHRGRGA